MSIDYRELLKKYICHVDVSEGTTFIDGFMRPSNFMHYPKEFQMTQEELVELNVLDQEVSTGTKI